MDEKAPKQPHQGCAPKARSPAADTTNHTQRQQPQRDDDQQQDQHELVRQLVTWARDEHGASFPKLQFDHAGGRPRRLLLTAPAEAGEPLISLPRALLMYGELAYEDPEYGEAFKELRRLMEGGGAGVDDDDDDDDDGDDDDAPLVAEAAAGGPLDARSALVLLVAVERCRGARSRWAPYIAALPIEYDDPAWWSERDRARLRGTRLGAAADRYDRGLNCVAARLALLEQLLQRRGRRRRQRRAAGEKAAEEEEQQQQEGPLSQGAAGPGGWGPIDRPGEEARKAARWARSVVWSRAFGVARFGFGGGEAAPPRPAVCLLPVLDMADHHPEARVAWHLGEDGRAPALEFSSRVLLPTPTPAEAPAPPSPLPQELWNNYGVAKPTEELILAYGFDLGAEYARKHDGFLVSVALGGKDDGVAGAGRLSPEEWDALAALQLRRGAAAGMARDVPLPPPAGSAPPSLPSQLLDLLVAAAGAPDFAILQREGRAPCARAAPPSWRLAALDALEAQLRAKRAPLAWAEHESDGTSLTPHGRMARSYALGQLARLDEAAEALRRERARAALAALAACSVEPAPLPAEELSRAGLRAEWVAGGARFVREPWSLERPGGSDCPPSVGLAVDAAAAANGAPPLLLLRLPLSACVAVPLGEDDRGLAEQRLIDAAAEALEAQAVDWATKPMNSWLLACARADAADGLLTAALLVAAAAAAAGEGVAPAEAASAASVRELIVLARGGDDGCDPDDDFAMAMRRLCARGIVAAPLAGVGGGEAAAAADALRAACRAHAALLVTRGGVLVATAAGAAAAEEDSGAGKRWLVLAPVLCRIGAPVFSALPLEARVVATAAGGGSATTAGLLLAVSLHVGGTTTVASALLLGSRTGAAAEGRLAAAVAAEAGLAAALSTTGGGNWPAAVAGAVPWSRAVDDEDDEDNKEEGAGPGLIKIQARLLLVACCVGVGELLLPPLAPPTTTTTTPPSAPSLSRAERLVLGEVLTSRLEALDADGAAADVLLRSAEARELLDAQAASAAADGGGAGGGGGGSAPGSASGLPPAGAAATPEGEGAEVEAAAERRLDAARRAFASRCFADLREACVEAARGLQRALKEMAQEAEGRAEQAGGDDDDSESSGPLAELVRRAWIGAEARTLMECAEEIGRWRKVAKGGGGKGEKKKKIKDKTTAKKRPREIE